MIFLIFLYQFKIFSFFNEEINIFVEQHIILLSSENYKSKKLSITIPDLYILCGIDNEVNSFKKISFDEKLNIGKFIGSPTGVNYSFENRYKLQRILTCLESKKYPELLDCKLISHKSNGTTEIFTKFLDENIGNIAPYENHQNLLKYKYLLCFDGNTSPWKRPEIIMHSGSLLLFQTIFDKFWTDLLVPFDIKKYNEETKITTENYIKIENNNIIETILFLNEHQELCQDLIFNAEKLAKNVLTDSFIFTYFKTVMEEVFTVQSL